MRLFASVVLVGLGLAACTAPTEGLDSTSSAQTVSGRWIPSSIAKTAGAKVKIPYESPPKWQGTRGCGGKLLAGSSKLGTYLQDKYTVITSVGGYSCRQNTANKSETSVHGTGRALDIMIPTLGGQADNTAGDPIANWLVQNATRIGIQLVIWDHSVWHCDGRNDTPYTGPIPHVDHIHAELTKAAAAKTTAFFTDGTMDDTTDDDDAGTMSDGGTDSSTTDTDTTDTDTDTGDTDPNDDPWDTWPDDEVDAGTDSGTTTPPKVDAGSSASTPTTTGTTTPPVVTDESHDDGAADEETIPPSSKERTKSPAPPQRSMKIRSRAVVAAWPLPKRRTRRGCSGSSVRS